jgi:ABC-2 type transport system ATP-binding protein
VRRERVEGLLDDVGLAQAGDVHLRKYSKGMLQRIGIAQALVNDPELVLLDEPMTGLDPVGRVEVKRIIESLHERGKTVLFNSHILSDVHELCSRIAIMREGRVVWRGTVPEALADSPTLEDFFMKVVTA